MSIFLNIYYRLPTVMRNFIASMYGYQLNRLRYNRNTINLVNEAHERESWGIDKWRVWQKKAISELLRTTALHVPYYKNYWRGITDSQEVLNIENWPIIEKKMVRKQPEKFISDLSRKKRLHRTFTSGSTGTPLKIYWSVDTIRKWYALFEARCRYWYGVTRFDPWAIIGGKQIVKTDAKKPPYWVYNYGMNQLYLSAYHLSVNSASAYVQALFKYKIQFIYTYTSGIYSLASFISKLGIKAPNLKVIVTNAEPLYDYQRALISSVFNCPVRETYGMAEMVAGAGECERGNLHLWPDAGYYEVDTGGGCLERSGSGQLIATGLINWDMPLIRFRVGDTVSISHKTNACSCGRRLQRLRNVEGRNDDLLVTKDGREIGRLDVIFKASYPIEEAQIIQKRRELCVIKIVPSDEYCDSVGDEIAEALKVRMGNIQVDIELVETIPRGVNGKFRAVIKEI